MAKTGLNRREHPRIYFTPDQVVEAILSSSESCDKQLRVKVLNLSEGGLFFIHTSKNQLILRPGETLFLESLEGPISVSFPREIALEIKWVSSDPGLEYSGYGCEFVDLPAKKAQVMRNIVTHFLSGNKKQ